MNNNKTTTFELYRYQLLPIDRYLQGDLLTGVSSIEELIVRKNDLFADALRGTSNFSNKRHETVTKKLYDQEDFILLRVATNRSMHRETKDFKNELIDNWPSMLIGIWNHPDVQMFAVQKRTAAFANSETAVRMLISGVSKQLTKHHLRAIEEPLFEKRKFWAIIEKHQGKIKSVEFEIITPNMANISGTLPDDLRNFAKGTNTTRSNLKISSDPEAPLHLEESNDTLRGLVEYSSEGGGNISLKIDGIKKKYHTSNTVKEIQIGETEIQGTAEELVKVLKEMLR